MNEQAFNDLYEVFVNTGYRGAKADFKNLMSTNSDAFNEGFGEFTSTGYNGDADAFALIGRARIGYMGYGDYAAFGHRDGGATAGKYALVQYTDGTTYLNTGSGSLHFRENNTTKMHLTGGNLGIGTTTPGAKLEVNGTSNFTGIMYIDHGGSDYSPNISFLGGTNTPGSNAYENAGIGYYDNSGTGNMKFFGNRGAMNWIFTDADETLFLMNNTGDFHCEADVIAYSTSTNSDRTLKENINPIPYGLEEVLKMNPVEYDWKEKRNKAHDIGVIAQEIEKIIPEVVQENKDLNSDKMIKSVDYGKMVAVLIKAVQEQQVQIDELKDCQCQN